MATYIVDSTGNNNAEILGDFTTSDVAQTVTFNAGTDGEAKPLKVLETTKQWLVVEVREVGGTAGVIGKHVYSEDVVDIQTRVEAIRQEMIALHSSFTITCTHYKTNNTCDVYRGDEATIVALNASDGNIAFTPPNVWVIDDLTPFAPTTPVASNNIIADPTCDNPGDWSGTNANATISGGILTLDTDSQGGALRVYPSITESLETGITYKIGCNVLTSDNGPHRFYVGGTAGGFLYGTGDQFSEVTWSGDSNTVSIQALAGTNITADDFYCERI